MPAHGESPLRSQLFSAEQMERHGSALARAHKLDSSHAADLLLVRLSDNQKVLERTCDMLAAAARDGRRLTPADEWLLDNIYLIEEQVRIAQRHLPSGYSRELPRLAEGPSAGLPRVYDIALNAISHGGGRIDAESLSRFIAAYQSVAPLKLGELWAIPIMLRLALIENLRRVGTRVISDRADRNLADTWADEFTRVAESDPKGLVLVIADMMRSQPPMSQAFVAELTRRLQGQTSALALPLTWLEQWLADGGNSSERMVHAENRQQATEQVSISNSIGSLRFLGTMDWREFVETMSVVDQVLRMDPDGTYGSMDFATRDHYRHVVERIARRHTLTELEVAEATLALAQAASSGGQGAAHVGYYLIDEGRSTLEGKVARGRFTDILRRNARRVPLLAYTAPIAIVVALFTTGLVVEARSELNERGLVWLVAVLCVIAFSELGVALVNWAATVLASPRMLPRLDYSSGIPAHARTLVAVPTMFGNVATVQMLAEALEVRFLANRDTNLKFALLTDFFDAKQEVLDGDAALLDAAAVEIDALNARHATDGEDIFFLLHRPRTWNPREGVWMGHERKRGKLAALNRFLRDPAGAGQFLRIAGDPGALGHVRYVITLDTDTSLPRGAARDLVGTLAHPLNWARFDPKQGRVTSGYTILQPRVGISMSGQRRSWYTRLYGSEPGIDPYTRAVSDVYQDLFNEGSFVGKGIYDVDAFELSLGGRFPDNSILSHDLLEGCYARAGLISDIQLYEGYPSRYAADVKRRHRWIRGDWQLLPWLLPSTPRADGSREPNALSTLSQGKILDNLRRSLVPAAMVGLLLMGWLLAPDPGNWTLWVLSILLVPPSVASLRDFFIKPVDVPLRAHFRQASAAIVGNYSRVPLTLACLPFEAFFSLDAILRTLWRLVISERHLLQWSPSSEVERNLDDSLGASFRLMWSAPAAAIATAMALMRLHPSALPVAGPILLLWLLSPAIMWWLGLPRLPKPAALSSEQRHFLGSLARRTWSFFETWVTEADHWLPPDNIQEHPALQVAHRTSPTNIGLSLLANLSAYDFGYLQTGGVIRRTAQALATLESLPRHRGHFYNWYDTQTLQPLPPRYVSTVDSGNLAGHLLTLRQGLLALIDSPMLAASTWQGLADTFGILRETMQGAPYVDVLTEFGDRLDDVLSAPPQSLSATWSVVEVLLDEATRIHQACAGEVGEGADWAESLQRQCLGIREELQLLVPRAMSATGSETASGARVSAVHGQIPQRDRIPTLREIAEADLSQPQPGQDSDSEEAAVAAARARIVELERLAHVAGQCAQMDFVFLYDRSRHLLSIGYNVTEHRRDPGFYDLLASEARLANFVAIAQNQLPQESWFSLGRLLTEVGGDPALLSWSGSMFEYLMPQLVMPNYEGTLLDQTGKAAVQRQIDYGQQRRVPWGISESGYNMVDAGMNYQYRAFGVPGLGLRRGLAEDLVVAPYASMMALMVAPEAACANLQRLSQAGFSGRYGLYEAIDYTPQRLPRGQDHTVVRSYMAHHQGMGLLSLDYLLRGQPMQERFLADAEFQATLLLLQERIPRTGAFHPHSVEAADAGGSAGARVDETRLRVFHTPAASRPAVQMLSNGRYHVMVSNAGGGYSRSGELAVTRWREDGTRDHWGSFCYLRDVDSGEFWSAAHQPTTAPVDGYEVIFSDAKIEFRGRSHGFETHLEIAVSPEDDIELRRLKLTNLSRKSRTIEITTYAEVVLAPGIADELHPAFSNLFVQTELLPERRAIICTRRPRALHEVPPWMFHLMQVHGAGIDAVSYETDRTRFVGRGNDVRRPQALTDDEILSGSQGSVLDPVVAIRCRITLAPEQVANIDMVTGVSANRDDCSGLIDKYRDRRLADRVFDLAWTHSQVVRRQINATQSDAQLYERMAGLVIYAHQALRADPSILLQNRRGQSGLWGQAISGDHPIVLLQIADPDNIELVRQMVQAHAYWRLKGLTVDLVILNEDQGGYRQQLQDQIMGLISASVEGHVVDRPGGIFVRAAHQLPHDERILLQSVSRVIISDALGKLAEQVSRRVKSEPEVPLLTASPVLPELMQAAKDNHGDSAAPVGHGTSDKPVAIDPWPFDPVVEPVETGNGLGGFSADGREYVIDLQAGQTTPAPWSNVLANPEFGSVVSESSAGYTWGENAHEFRLTPWHDDPVTDASGEAFYLRDEEDGRVWSPQPLPARGEGSYRTRHGFGYSVYEHVEHGIASELWVFVSATDAIKYSVLKLRNVSARRRRVSVTGYVEWILGDLHAKTRMYVVSERDGESGALTARNPYNIEFSGRMAFFDIDAPDADPAQRSFTTDRAEFLGHNGTPRAPVALLRERLSDRLGVGMDPCAAIMQPLVLEAGQESEVVFRMGMGRDHDAARTLARRARGVDVAHDALDAVRVYWLSTLGAVQVETPDAGINALANGWLLYQTIACRFFARSGYYQSGGAVGFRDQLQDSMAMLHAEPALARKHLLLCAAHQFPEGDVQHWWHPPLERGVRTRCSDDYLWLPYVTCRYMEATSDDAVLGETVAYIEGRPVNQDEESYYDMPTQSGLREPLYQHCVRALDRALGLLGARGLPLMRTGDWNDGMNRVGDGEQGESVWLGFFLYETLSRFSSVAQSRGDLLVAERYVQAASMLRENLDRHAWDGAWYRRAWFDNGMPLGSTESDECRIDSIAQSWSVLSGAGDAARARQAMDSLDQHLVRRDAGLIQLLDPPFDKTPQDPGYIRGYVPGVRENGGQYTHAAIWATMAFAKLGDSERAWELLRLIDPTRHGATPEQIATYKVEPYVVAADVYAVHPHIGRGGWTWYTGSAGWMYRLIVESLLGMHLEGRQLRVVPCIPQDWNEYHVRYRYKDAMYQIHVKQSAATGEGDSLSVDGVLQPDLAIQLTGDVGIHHVQVLLDPAKPGPGLSE